MKTASKWFLLAVSFFAMSTVFGQAKSATSAMKMLIGNVTVNDAQAAVNDKFAELVTKYSGGRITATAHHGGSLGNNVQMLAALQAGSLHGTSTLAGFISGPVPELSLFDLPFLMRGSPADITAFAAQSKAAAKLIEIAGRKGIHIIGFNGIGHQNLLTKFPVNKLADVQGKKFRVIPSPIRVGSYQDWGAVVRPMSFGEVYTALQQGTIDGIENPPDIVYKAKFFEVAKYYTITEHTAVVNNIIVSKKWFDGLPKDLQDVVTKAGKETIAFASKAFSDAQDSSMEALKKNITVTSMPAAEVRKMKDLAFQGVWEKMKKDPQKGPIVKLLQEDVERFGKR